MNRKDIIRMAREAGSTRDFPERLPDLWTIDTEGFQMFAALVAAAEREECAKLCEEATWVEYPDGLDLAAAIRARGQS